MLKSTPTPASWHPSEPEILAIIAISAAVYLWKGDATPEVQADISPKIMELRAEISRARSENKAAARTQELQQKIAAEDAKMAADLLNLKLQGLEDSIQLEKELRRLKEERDAKLDAINAR